MFLLTALVTGSLLIPKTLLALKPLANVSLKNENSESESTEILLWNLYAYGDEYKDFQF
jgi:hypothetical protein